MSPGRGDSGHPQVAAVVLTWNDQEETVGCVEQLAASDWPRLVTIIVDNGSEQPIQSMIPAHLTDVVVVRNPTNLGFAGGMNTGIRRALELESDYVLLLNNDTQFDETMVRGLVEAARERADTGIVSPLEFFRDEPETISSAGMRCDLRRGYQGAPLGNGQRDAGQFDGITEVDLPTGTAMLAPTDVVREIGLLDEELFFYIEDADWALRMRKAGKRMYTTSKARLWHGVATSSGGEDSPLVTYYHARNVFVVTARHLPLRGPRGFLRHCEILVMNLLHALRCRRPIANVRAVFAAWRDYLRGRLGPHPDSLRPRTES